ncbi:ZN774 protein, partial [Fregata magnificens]|nr:ZN774 protein [Fregata magnificens]
HIGERPYRCPNCGKGFTTSSKLIKHQQTHMEQAPYKFSLCRKSYKELSHGSNLMSHQRIHHGKRPYRCPNCGKGF